MAQTPLQPENLTRFSLRQVASRLSAADTLPMNRLLGFGAKYLQTHYSAWAAQQGGYVRNT